MRGKSTVVAEAETTVETYQRAVARLTAENKALREQVAELRTANTAEVRALKAQLNEGLSPELAALRRQLDRQTSRANAAEGRLARAKREMQG